MEAKQIVAQHQPGGCVVIPPSKSVSHRMVIGAALAQGTSTIRNILMSQDIEATCQAMTALGATITRKPEAAHRVTLVISGVGRGDAKGKTFDCNESGSTLRFLVPILALDAKATRVVGHGRLSERPMKPYYDIFDAQGIDYNREEDGKELPLSITGQLTAGTYALPGDVSSQFITGLLYALPLLDGDSTIEITTKLESKPYVDITLEVLERFGIVVEHDDYRRFTVAGNQAYTPQNLRVEGDYSQAAFWMVAGVIGGGLDCMDLPQKSCQGDQAIVDILKEMGASITPVDNGWKVASGALHGTTIDVSQCPDLVPVLAVAAALAEGETRVVGGERLRFKESDRLAAVTDVLSTIGADIKETPDGLIINGVDHFTSGQVDSYNDHRIAMAIAVASIASTGDIVLTRPSCVKKSYPEFWEVFNEKGGVANGIDLGK